MKSGTIVKIIFLEAVLVTAGIPLGIALGKVHEQYGLLFSPGEGLLELALWVFGSILLTAAAAGLVAALVRPFWVILLGFGLSALALAAAWKFSLVAVILGLVYLALGTLYAHGVVQEMANRLKFSVRPLAEKQKTLLFALVLITAISFAWGYHEDTQQNKYLIPPQVKQMWINMAMPFVRAQIESQGEVPPEMAAVFLAEAQRALEQSWTAIEAQVRPYRPYIPFILAFFVFLTLQGLLGLVSWLPVTILSIIFPILAALGMTHTVAESKEAQRVTLD